MQPFGVLDTIEPTRSRLRMQGEGAARLERLIARFATRRATVAVIGLGHVGLPLALVVAEAGFQTLGLDTDPVKLARLAAGDSPLREVPTERLRAMRRSGRFALIEAWPELAEADAILICVPTPLGPAGEPDLSHVVAAAQGIAAQLRPGQLVVLESTTWPGTTRGVVLPILEASGLRCGRDVFLAYSPEREDPGNPAFRTATIPKLLGGADAASLRLAEALYGAVMQQVVPVASLEAAEAAKLVENVFRAVNIGLVNELKLVLGGMGIDVWEVIRAAATKPFGYMPFWPGPGVGGHCIPVDPVYLAWQSRRCGVPARLVELAGEINAAMPRQVVGVLARALGERGLRGSRVLLLGLGYKRNHDDLRESASLRLLELLEAAGATVDYFDPLVPRIGPLAEHPRLSGRAGIAWSSVALRGYDAALIATDHDDVDYAMLAALVPLVVDTRDVCARLGLVGANIVKA